MTTASEGSIWDTWDWGDGETLLPDVVELSIDEAVRIGIISLD
jgi:hypothetical protein